MEMSPVIVLKIFTPSWRFSTTFLDFSKLMSSPKTEELYISQTSYIKPNLTSNIKTVKIKQRIKCFVKNLIILKISLLGCLKYFMIRCRHYPPVTTLPDLTVHSYQGFGSRSELDPDSSRSVDPYGGLQQDQHCRHHEHAGTYFSFKASTD
jgi:hypothetical protein